MNDENDHASLDRLSSLLRESQPEPGLPPRFREGVWRRIDREREAHRHPVSWVERLAVMVLRPRYAIAAAVALLLLGTISGVIDGTAAARHLAQERYLYAIVPEYVR